MQAHAEVAKKERSRPAVHSSSGPEQSRGHAIFPRADIGAEGVQRKLQERADNSPRVRQLEAIRNLVNSRPSNSTALVRAEPASVVQRVQVTDSMDGKVYETDDMTDEEIHGLALKFYQLSNIQELRKIQAARGDLDISDSELYVLAYGEPHPRTRKRHPDSEGESDNEDRTIAYRSLREDEQPLDEGLKPPVGHDPTITPRAHISAGTKAIKKSRYISGSRSKKVAGAWASKNKRGRVARFDLPPEAMDLTRPAVQDDIFPGGAGTSLNTAKASQEVLVPDLVPSHMIQSIYEAVPLSVTEYRRRKAQGGQELFRSRTKVKGKARPAPYALRETYNRDASSARWLRLAREYWDSAISRLAEDSMEEIDAEEVAEFLQERADNPYELDFIENEAEFEEYLAEIERAVVAYRLSR